MSKEKLKRAKRKAADVRKMEMEDMSEYMSEDAYEWMERRAYPKSRLSPAAQALIRAQGKQMERGRG